MTPEQILSHAPRVLTQAQRESYFANGYLGIQRFVDADTVAALLAVTRSFIDESRFVTRSGRKFDVAPGHSAAKPLLRRLKRPDEQHPLYWDIAKGALADVAADLVGPDVLYHHSKLNFKWHDGDDKVEWHQDIPFYPHTNYSPLTIGIYLHDTDIASGALSVLPGSHDGPVFDHRDARGNWTGCLTAEETTTLDLSRVAYVEGPAGTITIHNSRTLHATPPSQRAGGRPLLLHAYSSADAIAYTPHPDPSAHAYEVLRGRRATHAHHDPRPCPIPPDWSGGYTSIFAAQAQEAAAAE